MIVSFYFIGSLTMKIIKEKHYSSYETKQIVGWCIKHDIEIINVDINQIPYYEDAVVS